MENLDLESRLSFIREAERLKNVLRSAYTSEGRKESTAEHTWRLCLMAMVFEDSFGALDFARLLKMCVLHDLGEAIHGDVPAVEQHAVPDKAARERDDFLTLIEPLPPGIRADFLALWDDYDRASSPEARAVKALDKLETIMQHNQGANPAGFDYAFNLYYGEKYTSDDALFSAIRAIVDAETRKKAENSRA